MFRHKWSRFAVAGVFATALVIGAGILYWYLEPLTDAGTESARIHQTEELLLVAKRHPTGELPHDESVPEYLWGITDNCWASFQNRSAANIEQPVISIARKSPDGRWYWVRVKFADASWIELSYYQGLLSLCETGTP